LHLILDGLGKRGVLRETKLTGQAGTEVRVTLKERQQELAENLAHVVRARAPMLKIPLVVSTLRSGATSTERIEPGWWQRVPEQALVSFIRGWLAYSQVGKLPDEGSNITRRSYYRDDRFYGSQFNFGGKWLIKGWPGAKPEFVDDSQRLLSLGGERSFGIVSCSQGIAVEAIRVPDITGLIEIGAVELTASRESIARAGGARGRMAPTTEGKIADRIISALKPAVVARLDELHTHGMLPSRIAFLRGMASIFGSELLGTTKLKWISVTLPSGNLIHHSKPELLHLLQNENRILLATGISAGGAYAVASSYIPPGELARMPVVSIGTEEFDVKYSVGQQFEHEGLAGVLKGTLNHIISVVSEQSAKSDLETSEVELNSNLVLTNFLLECVAGAWGMAPRDLRNQSWYLHYKENVLYADLRRV
jgi:hypothetical protein